MQIEELKLKIGDYHLHDGSSGIFGLDGGAMFGTVPKVLWQKSNPPDSENRIEMEARTLILVSPKHKIVVDCGIGGDFLAKYGEKLGSKFTEMYAIDSSQKSLQKSLQSAGITAEDVTDVILTHLHFDHAGGSTCVRDGHLLPTFANAKYYVQKGNLEAAKSPNPRERASYFAANFQPLLDAGVLQLLEGNVENLLPGISVEVTNGHTFAQQIVRITDGHESLVYCGDLIPTSSHVRVPWIMGYDLHPLMIMDEKRKLLERAAQGNWLLYFEHDPYIAAARVEAARDDFAVKSRYRLV